MDIQSVNDDGETWRLNQQHQPQNGNAVWEGARFRVSEQHIFWVAINQTYWILKMAVLK